MTASSFASMAWIGEKLGAAAIVEPGQAIKDRLRHAIQIYGGPDIPRRIVYKHTGWRKLERGWAYLHGGGAIGSDGPVPGVEVDLPPALATFSLVSPA